MEQQFWSLLTTGRRPFTRCDGELGALVLVIGDVEVPNELSTLAGLPLHLAHRMSTAKAFSLVPLGFRLQIACSRHLPSVIPAHNPNPCNFFQNKRGMYASSELARMALSASQVSMRVTFVSSVLSPTMLAAACLCDEDQAHVLSPGVYVMRCCFAHSQFLAGHSCPRTSTC